MSDISCNTGWSLFQKGGTARPMAEQVEKFVSGGVTARRDMVDRLAYKADEEESMIVKIHAG